MNEIWLAAAMMFWVWMGTTFLYMIYGYPIKMMVRDEEIQLKKLEIKNNHQQDGEREE